MGAAASRDPPRALVEACATLDASELREIARRFRDASRPPPTTRAEDLLGDAWPAAETPRALALALVALPDALDPANPALASAFDLPPGAVAESAFTPAREYETGDADDPRRDIDSAATPNSQTPRRAPPRGAFPWTVAARAAALRESRDARAGRGAVRARPRVRTRGGVALRGRGCDDDEDRGARRGAAPPRRRRGRRRSETYERLERSKVSNVRPNTGPSSFGTVGRRPLRTQTAGRHRRRVRWRVRVGRARPGRTRAAVRRVSRREVPRGDRRVRRRASPADFVGRRL